MTSKSPLITELGLTTSGPRIGQKLFLFLLVFILAIAFVAAPQPTQQYNKIFLEPFYRASMTQNINYTYTVMVRPPDGITEIKSAILTLDAWINPTRTAFAWANGKACNTPSYTITTTYAGAGRAVFTFDCINAILPNQNNTVTFMITGGNIGASTAWLDLTYMNRPIGDVEVGGTEYAPGDPATIFVQLKDAYGNAIENGACYLDIWYPANESNIHPYTVRDAPMLTALGDDGMYYYDLVAPDQLGVYMLSAKCSYSYNWMWFYPENELLYYPVVGFMQGTWTGAGQVLNSFADGQYLKSVSAGGLAQIANYTYNLSTYGPLTNITNVNVYFAGSAQSAGTLTIAYYNGTTFVNAPNVLTFLATATATAPALADQFLTTTIPASAIINNTVILRTTYATGGGTQSGWYNWLAIAVLSSAGTIQDVKGSSEMHITDRVGEIGNNTLPYLININQTLTDNLTVQKITESVHLNLTPFFNQSVIMLYSGTEYQSGEEGKIVLQVLKDVAGGGNQPQTGLSCNDTIIYPNGTIFDSVIMAEILSPNAVYTHNFTVPSPEGVYIAYTVCTEPGKTYYGLHTFHVAPWINTINSIYSLLNSTYNVVVNINTTTTNTSGELYNLQTTVNSMNNLLIFMNQTNTDTYNLLTTVNGDIVFINGSLNTLNNNMLSINGTLSYLSDVIVFINGTTTSNSQSLLDITGILARINDTVLFINGTDTTILGIVNTTNENILFINGTTTNINDYLQGYITGSLFNLTTTANNIYDTVTFINSTTIEINGTTHNIYSYLTSTIFSLLYDINQTVNSIDGNFTADLSSIEARLITLEQVTTNLNIFTQEQAFLITDSVGQVKTLNSNTYANKKDIDDTLNQVSKNLNKFLELNAQKQEDTPNKTLNLPAKLDSGLVILLLAVVVILIISRKEGLIRNSREQPKLKTREVKLSSRNDRISYLYEREKK